MLEHEPKVLRAELTKMNKAFDEIFCFLQSNLGKGCPTIMKIARRSLPHCGNY